MLRHFHKKGLIEAGCDEAGRGCLAGPVVAAAVILNPGERIRGIADSKTLSPKKREDLAAEIIKKSRSYAIYSYSNEEIDRMNILRASFMAMHRCIDQLECRPDHLLIDGNRFIPYPQIAHTCFVKGDSRYAAIAAASILAKHFRDQLMLFYHARNPHFEWSENKGYPTKAHRQKISKAGRSLLHRKSFKSSE